MHVSTLGFSRRGADMKVRTVEQMGPSWSTDTRLFKRKSLFGRKSMRRDVALPRLKLKAMTLFRNKYRIESARKRDWDYTSGGWYFVTICTKDLSDIGNHASGCWNEIPSHHPDVNIDEFIVMPNHVHGIIVLSGPEHLPRLRRSNEIRRIAEFSSVHPKTGSLGAVIGSFKSAVTRWCRSQELPFGWQARFHDRIIRGRNSLEAIREYIQDNLKNWRKDSEFIREE